MCYTPRCLKGSSDQNYSLEGLEDVLTARQGAERGKPKTRFESDCGQRSVGLEGQEKGKKKMKKLMFAAAALAAGFAFADVVSSDVVG